jgi:hypothetical protein
VQSKDPLLRGFTEQKLAEDKPSGKRPFEVKVTFMIRILNCEIHSGLIQIEIMLSWLPEKNAM